MNYKYSSDKELLDLLKAGKEKAFTEIYNRYWKRLLSIAYNLTKDKSTAQEIVQEIFTGLWIKQADLNIESLNGYLATAVRFSVFKLIYRQKRRLEIELQNCKDELSTLSEDQIDARFTQEFINRVVEQLPEKCKLVFKYSRNAGLTIPEISMELSMAEKTVEGHLTKGLKTIRLSLRNLLNLFLGIVYSLPSKYINIFFFLTKGCIAP